MARWELTNELSKYLDRHLVIPLLEFHTHMNKGMYDETDLSKAKLDLLKHTSMVDFYMEEYKKLYPDSEDPPVRQSFDILSNSLFRIFQNFYDDTPSSLLVIRWRIPLFPTLFYLIFSLL